MFISVFLNIVVYQDVLLSYNDIPFSVRLFSLNLFFILQWGIVVVDSQSCGRLLGKELLRTQFVRFKTRDFLIDESRAYTFSQWLKSMIYAILPLVIKFLFIVPNITFSIKIIWNYNLCRANSYDPMFLKHLWSLQQAKNEKDKDCKERAL